MRHSLALAGAALVLLAGVQLLVLAASPEKSTPVPDPMKVPRFSGIATFLKLPAVELDDRIYTTAKHDFDVALLGLPFDAAVSYLGTGTESIRIPNVSGL